MVERALLRVAYVLVGILSLAWLSLNPVEAAPDFPALTGRVVDEAAGVLSDGTKRELDGILAGDQAQFGGRQIVVVTVKSLQGQEIEDYGYQLGRHWGIGQKGKNNGALVIVAPKEHAARIEVGYGLEGELTRRQEPHSDRAHDAARIPQGRLQFGRPGGDQGGAGDARQHPLRGARLQPGRPGSRRAVGQLDRPHHLPADLLLCRPLVLLAAAVHGRLWRRTRRLGGGGFSGGGGGFGGGGFSGGGGSFGGGGATGRW